MELWTSSHLRTLLPAVAVMVAVAILLRLLLGKKSLAVRMIPLKVLACLLVALEIGKQVLSLARGYDLYHLPFHFCSLFIFALPLMAFYQGKHRQRVGSVVSALCTAVFLLMLIYPNIIYGAGNIQDFFSDYFSFHTVTFHNLVMLAFLLIVALELYEPTRGDIKAILVFTVCFCAVAATMSQLLKTNYANMYTCNVPILETLRVHMQGVIGAVPTQLLYVLANTALHLIFVSSAYGFCCLTRFPLTRWTGRGVRSVCRGRAENIQA